MTQVQSKKQIAGLIFNKMFKDGKSRKEIICEMCDKANLSQNGASTYYANFKSGLWSLTTKKDVVQEEKSVDIVSIYDDEEGVVNCDSEC